MKTRKIKRIHQIITGLFCLAILTQNGVEAPVLCFETDGHINLEAGCDISCKIPEPKNDEHQDDCDDCIDIHLWNYNPDLTFLFQSFDFIMLNFYFLKFLYSRIYFFPNCVDH